MIAEVCSGSLADLYPKMALTRLGHVALHKEAGVAEAVAEAVVRIWKRPTLRSHTLRVLIAWANEGDDRRREISWQIFGRLAADGAHPLLVAGEQPDARTTLVTACVKVIADSPSSTGWIEFTKETLSTALTDAEHRASAIRFFMDVVSRGDGGSTRMVRLQEIAFSW